MEAWVTHPCHPALDAGARQVPLVVFLSRVFPGFRIGVRNDPVLESPGMSPRT